MKQTMKRLTALLLALSLLLGFACVNAGAADADLLPEQTKTEVYINPAYESLVGVQDLEQPEAEEMESPDLSATTYYTTVAAAGKAMSAAPKSPRPRNTACPSR